MNTRFVLLALFAGTLWSQQLTIGIRTAGGPPPAGFERTLGTTIKGAPYSAEVTMETTQVLADGNRVVNRHTGFVARDSQGRTRNDSQVQLTGPGSQARKLIMMHDPVAQVTYTLDSESKTARKMSTAGNSEADLIKQRAEFSARSAEPQPGAPAPAGYARKSLSNTKTEALGTQVIESVVAEGTRTTETIAAGEIGNDKEIQIVNEVWVAQDLQAVVLSKRSDPLSGEMTYKLTNIQRAEPAASTFEVPSEYQVVDGPPKTVIIYKPKD